jgi:hypothetical protein
MGLCDWHRPVRCGPLLTACSRVPICSACIARFGEAELGFEDVLVLERGNAAWCGADLTPASGPTHLFSPRDDVCLASSERPGDARANVMASLDWETLLLAAIERGGCVPFRNVLWH